MARHDLMTLCPKFESCSAPVCPLDPIWRQVPHLAGERVCLYLTERAKNGGEARLSNVLPTQLAELVSEAYSELLARDACAARGHGEIRRTIERAAETGSLIERGRQLASEAA
jgi:hypothetical protein